MMRASGAGLQMSGDSRGLRRHLDVGERVAEGGGAAAGHDDRIRAPADEHLPRERLLPPKTGPSQTGSGRG
jgi:hypothetical protein